MGFNSAFKGLNGSSFVSENNASEANTGLVKIMLTLMDYFSPADRRTPWVI